MGYSDQQGWSPTAGVSHSQVSHSQFSLPRNKHTVKLAACMALFACKALSFLDRTNICALALLKHWREVCRLSYSLPIHWEVLVYRLPIH